MPYERFGYALLRIIAAWIAGTPDAARCRDPVAGPAGGASQRPETSEAKRFQLPARSAYDTSASTERTTP